jgi:hypothetical protein
MGLALICIVLFKKWNLTKNLQQSKKK